MEEKKYLNLDMLSLYDALIKEFINNKIFIGTYEEYETANANGEIPIDTLVIITDDETTSGGSGGITEEQVMAIIEENIGDIDAVLDEINGSGTIDGSGSSEEVVEIEFSISASENQSTDYGEWILTQITPFTDWYKVKSAKLILKGTSDMPRDIAASYPNVMGMFEQGTNNANMFYLCSMVVENGSPSYSTFIYNQQNGFKYQGTGDFKNMVEMYLALGVTTCTLIVTI